MSDETIPVGVPEQPEVTATDHFGLITVTGNQLFPRERMDQLVKDFNAAGHKVVVLPVGVTYEVITPRVIGYMVVEHTEHGGLAADWDGEVYTDREEANAALDRANSIFTEGETDPHEGFFLVELRPVDPEAMERAR